MKHGNKLALSLILPFLLSLAATAQEVEVNSADPPSASRGTVNLNVLIRGKGFKRGAVARFFRTNTADPGGIRVNSTAFLGGTQVVANIDVEEGAALDKFDIEVQNRDGRTGKGIELFTVTESSAQSGDTLARADFRDLSTDHIRSDAIGLSPSCNISDAGYDFADFDDPCQPGHWGVSEVLSTGTYFLRTLSAQIPNPTRYLVLDFTSPLPGSSCPALDTELKDYPGRNPDAVSPENADPCIDYLEVRFFADKAYAPGAQYTPVNLVIDGPDLVRKRANKYVNQWNAKYYLDFVNPLTITRSSDGKTVIITTMAGYEQAQLWTVNQKTGKHETLLGTYWMPFEVTITTVP